MKNKRIIICWTFLLMAVCSVWATDPSEEWVPNEKYAHFTRHFAVDQVFSFENDCVVSDGGGSNGNCDNKDWSEDGVTMSAYPGYIAWAHVCWHEIEGADGYDNDNFDYLNLYLRNVETQDTIRIVKAYYDTKCDDYAKFSSVEDYNNCKTYHIGLRHYRSYQNGCTMAYFLIAYSDEVKQFIKNATANGKKKNVQIVNDGRWDNSGMTEDSYSSTLNDDDLAFILRDSVHLSFDSDEDNFGWCRSDSHTAAKLKPIASKSPDPDYGNNYDLHLYCSKTEIATVTGVTPNTLNRIEIPLDSLTISAMQNGRYAAEVRASKPYAFSVDHYTANTTMTHSTTLWGYSPRTPLPVVQLTKNGLTTIDNHDGTVTVSWQVSDLVPGREHNESNWVLERSKVSDFSSNPTRIAGENYSSGTTVYSFADNVTEREAGEKNYYYRLYRADLAPDEPSTASTCLVQTDYAKLHSFNLVAADTINQNLTVEWSLLQGIFTSSMKVQVLLNGVVAFQTSDAGMTRAVLENVPTCELLNLKVQLLDGSTVRSELTTEDDVLIPSHVGGDFTLSASKGYYNDHVDVCWVVDDVQNNFNYFHVLRKERDVKNASYQEVGNSIEYVYGTNRYVVTDNNVTQGTYYIYKVQGYSVCGDTVGVSCWKEDNGFAQPYGLVTGIVSYNGNQGVPDVDVCAIGSTNSRPNRTVRLDGSGYICRHGVQGIYGDSTGTIEMWIRPDTSEVFHHYARTWSGSDTTIYLDGRPYRGSVRLPYPDALVCNEHADSLMIGEGFSGWIDEIRCWSNYQDSARVAKYYNCYLSGGEDSLTVYYRCDDNIPGELYDLSRSGSTYHERHAHTYRTVFDINVAPTAEQLSLRAYTDKNGIYTINAIPYSATGSMYSILPMLGVHEFAPSSRSLYFTSNTATHNSIDFTDQSSFTVEGTVYYENTTIPVEGCSFQIDGLEYCMEDGEMIKTDSEGKYRISIPIGQHFIRVSKNGHTFTHEGRYPASGYALFDKPMTGLEFEDNTKVLLVGRVAGGNEQAALAHGLALGRNNIGVSDVVLKLTTNSAELNKYSDRDISYIRPDTFLLCRNHAVTTAAAPREIHFSSDTTTGEFAILVPPVDLMVSSVNVRSDSCFKFDDKYKTVLALSESVTDNYVDSAKLTVQNTEKVFYRHYNKKFDIIGYVQPTLDIRQGADTMLGDKQITRHLSEDSLEVLPAWNENKEYELGMPAFTSGSYYRWDMQLYDLYSNKDNPAEVRYDTVYWSKGLLRMNCELATTSKVETSLDERGCYTWEWVAGAPNMAEGHTKGMQIFFSDSLGKNPQSWDKNSSFRAMIFGTVKQPGNDFVTLGPNRINYILRCPPGESGGVTLASGSKISRDYTVNRHYEGSEEFVGVLKLGGKINTGEGFGLMVIEEYETKDEVTAGLSSEQSHTWTTNTASSYSISQDIAIERDQEYKGAEADVYYGYGTNLVFSEVEELVADYDSVTGTYSYRIREAIGQNDSIATTFAYSQQDILEREIPQLELMRSMVTVQHVDSYDSIPSDSSYVYRYYTTLAQDDPARFETGNYKVVAPGQVFNPVRDSLTMYNEAIKGWQQAVRQNEEMKIMAIGKGTSEFDRDKYEEAVTNLAFYNFLKGKNWSGEDYVEVSLQQYEYFKNVLDVVENSTFQNHFINYLTIQRWFDEYLPDDEVPWRKGADGKKPESVVYVDHVLSDFYTKGYFFRNYSVSGGASIHESFSTTSETGETSVYDYTVSASIGNKIGFSVMGIGFTVEISTKQGGGNGYDRSSKNEREQSISYELNAGAYEAYSVDVYIAPDGFGPIFYVRGGESYCPAEEPESAIFAIDESGNHPVLQAGTILLQQPQITINSMHEYTINDIPNGEAATVEIDLANLANSSNPSAAVDFILRERNSDGISVAVDGHTLGIEGQTVTLECPETYSKRLNFRQTDLSVTDADVIVFLRSDCDWKIADTAIVHLHFVPDCTPLVLETRSTVMNAATGGQLDFTVSGYDRNFYGFNGFRIEHRRVGDVQWITDAVIDGAGVTAATHSYTLSLANQDDGLYEVRAISLCGDDPTNIIEKESNILTLTKDMYSPTVLGEFEPANGYYTIGSDLAINWSEAIASDLLTDANFRIYGQLGEAEVDHNVGYRLNHPTTTEAAYSLQGTPFGIETWIRYRSGAGHLVSLGQNAWIGIEEGGRLSLHTAGGKSVTSTTALPTDEWAFLYVSVGTGSDSNVRAMAWAGSDSIALFNVGTSLALSGSKAPLTLGDEGLYAEAHDLRLWHTVRTPFDAQSQMYNAPYLYTEGLDSYWPMTEGHGAVLADLTRGRNLPISENAWYRAGTNYAAAVPTGGIEVNIADANSPAESEYLLEYWYRAAEGDTLFSLMQDTLEEPIVQSGYADGNWHRVALSYVRHGYASLYIDDNLVQYIPQSRLGGLVGNSLRIYGDAVDEIRFWQGHVDATVIKARRFERVENTAPGLVWRFAFERDTLDTGSQWQTAFTATASKGDGLVSLVNAASLTAAADCPPIVKSRPVEDVPFSFRSSSERTTFALSSVYGTVGTIADRLEGATLTVEAKNVYDLNGNMSEPMSWQFTVNRARLAWWRTERELSVEQDHSATITMRFHNRTGLSDSWTVSGAPTWLTLSETSGTVDGMMTVAIDATVSDALSPGYYTTTLYLAGSDGIRKPLDLTVHVYSHLPNWKYNEGTYDRSMNIVARAILPGGYSDNEENIVAAFVGDSCVAMAHTQYYEAYGMFYAMMSIGGYENMPSTPIEFRIWESTSGRIFAPVSVVENGKDTSVVFSDGIVRGSISRPIDLVATDNVQQNIALSKGWNWISFYVDPASNQFNDILKPILPDIDHIKSRGGFSTYNGTSLSGSVQTMSPESMYKMRMYRSDRLSVNGALCDPDEHVVTINPGWNWIGFISSTDLLVREALTSITPMDGDVIKNRTQFAVWDGHDWVGTLRTMRPGEGYMYYSQSTGALTLTYPTFGAYSVPAAVAARRVDESLSHYSVDVDGRYPTTMAIIGRVMNGTVELTDAELAAYVGTECRGVAAMDAGRQFLSLEGEAGETVTLHVWDGANEYIVRETIPYTADILLGSFAAPYIVQIGEDTSVESISAPDDGTVRKIVRDGIVYIVRDGKLYDLTGKAL